ncbi:MAG: hypothetical protein ACRECZ_05550, partial [Methylocella sp.]
SLAMDFAELDAHHCGRSVIITVQRQELEFFYASTRTAKIHEDAEQPFRAHAESFVRDKVEACIASDVFRFTRCERKPP